MTFDARCTDWRMANKAIRSFTRMPRNWDGEDADPIAPYTLAKMRTILDAVKEQGLPPPTTLSPGRIGNVVATWYHIHKDETQDWSELEITNTGAIEWLTIFVDGRKRKATSAEAGIVWLVAIFDPQRE